MEQFRLYLLYNEWTGFLTLLSVCSSNWTDNTSSWHSPNSEAKCSNSNVFPGKFKGWKRFISVLNALRTKSWQFVTYYNTFVSSYKLLYKSFVHVSFLWSTTKWNSYFRFKFYCSNFQTDTSIFILIMIHVKYHVKRKI